MGLASPSEKISNVLVNLYEFFHIKIAKVAKAKVKEVLERENYSNIKISNDKEFREKVDRYDIELHDYFRTNIEIRKVYPLDLPFCECVFELNKLMADTIESALDYWQFLLYSKEDFAKVANSTNQL